MWGNWGPERSGSHPKATRSVGTCCQVEAPSGSAGRRGPTGERERGLSQEGRGRPATLTSPPLTQRAGSRPATWASGEPGCCLTMWFGSMTLRCSDGKKYGPQTQTEGELTLPTPIPHKGAHLLLRLDTACPQAGTCRFPNLVVALFRLGQ